MNTLFVLLLETNVDRIWHTDYFLPKAERKECSVLIDWRNFFDQPTRNNLKKYENIRKIASAQGVHNWLFIRLSLFQENYKLIAINLNKQRALDGYPKSILNNFTGNLNQTGNATIFFILEKVKETFLDSSEGAVRTLWVCFINLLLFKSKTT